MNIEEVREALIEWENLSGDKKNRAEYEARLKELRDQLSNLQGYHRKGKEEGVKEGLKKGLKEGSKNIARNLLKKGFSPAEVADLTELSLKEILDL